MKHASPTALEQVGTLLDQLRALDGLKEKKPGVFYRRSRAFLHFHEDGGEVFADVRLREPEFDRFRCTTRREQSVLLKEITRCLREPGS